MFWSAVKLIEESQPYKTKVAFSATARHQEVRLVSGGTRARPVECDTEEVHMLPAALGAGSVES